MAKRKTKNRKVTKTMVREVVRDIKDFFGIVLDKFQVCYILLNYQEVRDDWDKIGDVDTAFRDKFLDAIVEECRMSFPWPKSYCTKLAKQAFEKEFKINAKKHGYKLTDDFTMVD